jgi:hypothetical protein
MMHNHFADPRVRRFYQRSSQSLEDDRANSQGDTRMPDQMSKDQEKIDEYLKVIQERILLPIQNMEVQRSCTATLLLLFVAIDSLGKLLDPNDAAGSNQRIRRFLGYMGGDYASRKKDLLKLRNSLVHNAFNVESYLARTESGSEQHLKKLGAAGFLYVNAVVMYKDFVDALGRFRSEIQHDSVMMKSAADRLEWKEDNTFNDLSIPAPTPPPPVQFLYAKCSPE